MKDIDTKTNEIFKKALVKVHDNGFRSVGGGSLMDGKQNGSDDQIDQG